MKNKKIIYILLFLIMLLLTGCKQQNDNILEFVETMNDGYYVRDVNQTNIKDIVIPKEYNGLPVRGIINFAFRNCTSLESVFIPNSVTNIEFDAFYGCTSLQSIKVSKFNNYYRSIDGNLYSKNGKTLIKYAIGKQENIFKIPNRVTNIGRAAFSFCTNLTNIVIPNRVTSIGDSAFAFCTNLTDIVIPDSVTFIDVYAFEGCASLITIKISNNLISIEPCSFAGCSSLESIIIPDGVTSIGTAAFRYCTSLTSITIPNSVTSIGTAAFESCTNLTSITIPDSVTSIGDRAFFGCTNLTYITIPNSVTSIGNNAFSGCSSLTIYCEVSSKPSSWDYNWNYTNCPVVWGYK